MVISQQCETQPNACARCGTALPSNQWYPVRTERDSSGELVVHYFCSNGCASEWADDGLIDAQ